MQKSKIAELPGKVMVVYTQYEIGLSEQVQVISYEYTEECIVKAGTEFKQSTSLGFQMGKLASLKGQLDAVVTSHIDSSISSTLKTSKKITQTYRLQEGVESGKQAVKKMYERIPVYYKFELLLKKQCRFCNNTRILPIEVYKRIPKVATRVTIYYTDNTRQTIDTGFVSIN